ncbi:ATP-dependent Clp protease proteolytic subunit [Bradyrhizobium diazoefficiens]|uniref:ATP-dependent Clp protease proteolytic subunit n=1 Tax=Bradyrhizobium sp. WYCCWR 12699 TaxID=3064203 RepID=UPI001BAC097D|nr:MULTISPECIES: ATP-dependent Clp protease proteolytic subunit [Bradyrhizobium]MBR0926080.1 ATP-dependent Clp protease proteolytic subunit [Bradyrhizobium diazoefficiens]MDT4743220.1 ATP-dependent Clp protease proteolytic subunit [Bradyrhizobium sp. WYCCWR 12699]
MSRLVTVLGAGGILLLWGICQMPSGSREAASCQTLSISEEPDRILLGWSGPVQEPMNERVGAALDQFKSDQRRLVLVLNSPGGSIEHGRKVVAAIRARNRAMDTFVQKAGVCASMCVPIFLAGTKRVADPDAYFMFHEASLTGSARDMMKRQELGEANRAVVAEVVKTVETQATDDLFHKDMGIRRVNTAWLAGLRKKIPGRDIWMSAQQLVDEGSGVVDSLSVIPPQ